MALRTPFLSDTTFSQGQVILYLRQRNRRAPHRDLNIPQLPDLNLKLPDVVAKILNGEEDWKDWERPSQQLVLRFPIEIQC